MSDLLENVRFLEQASGFRVEALGLTPVSVKLCATGYYVHLHRVRQQSLFDRFSSADQLSLTVQEIPSTTLVRDYEVVDLVAEGMLCDWKPPKGKQRPSRLKKRALEKARRVVRSGCYENLKRLKRKTDPTVWRTQSAVSRSTLVQPRLLHEPSLYRDKYLVGDIQKYRAVAAILPNAHYLAQRLLNSTKPPQDGFNESESSQPHYSVEDVLNCLSNWQGLCSPTGAAYRSLSRTLMNFPERVYFNLLRCLPTLRLVRPVTDRLELTTLLSAHCFDRGRDQQRLRPFHHVSETQIRDAMLSVSRAMDDKLDHQRLTDIFTFVRYLLDCPDERQGKFPSLVRNAIRWHQTVGWQESCFGDGCFDDATPTKKPPIDLPTIHGVRFLETVGDVLQESERMNHCISAYARQAVAGRSFLFHVDHGLESASAEVNADGLVQQSMGPRNKRNSASKFAESMLGRWGRGFATIQHRTPTPL